MPNDPHMLERAVLCHALSDPSGVTRDRLFRGLHPFLFREPMHRELFVAVSKLIPPLEEVSLAQGMGRLTLEECGGLKGLFELTRTVPHSGHADEHAKLLRETNVNDAYSEALEICKLDLSDGHSLKHSFRHLKELESPPSQNGHLSLQNAAKLAADTFLAIDSGELASLATPFPSVNTTLGGGFAPGLIIIAARPSVGKTALALTLALHYANDKTVAFLSLEMSASQLAARVIQSVLSLQKPTGPNFYTAEHRAKLRDAHLSLQSHLKIYDHVTALPDAIQAIRDLRPRIAFVDYLQLLDAGDADENRASQVTKISRSLKLLSSELDIPIIALAQVNREAEKHARSPKLSDLRESGSIEQDADVVLFLSRKPDEEEFNEQDITLDVAKNRNGPTGRTTLVFQRNLQRWREKEQRDEDRPHF